MLDAGHVKDLATLARYGQVSRARITQIMNLLNLAPDIQEQLLNLPEISCLPTHSSKLNPRPSCGRDSITHNDLQRVSLEPD